MAANVASAGPVVAAWLDWREGRGDGLAGRAGRYLAAAGLIGLLAAAGLGVLLFVLVWDDGYREAFSRLRPRVFAGIGELAFSLILMLAQWLWWKSQPTAGKAVRVVRGLLGVLAGTNLLYHFPVLFAVMSKAAGGGVPGDGAIRGSAFLQELVSGEVLSKSVHVWLASFAIAGLMLIGFALKASRTGETAEEVRRVTRWGASIALLATLLQIPVGLWLITQLPRPAVRSLMGQDMISTILFLVSVGLVFPLGHWLAAAAMREVPRKTLVRIMIAMTLIVVLMSGVLYRSNRAGREVEPAANAEAQP